MVAKKIELVKHPSQPPGVRGTAKGNQTQKPAAISAERFGCVSCYMLERSGQLLNPFGALWRKIVNSGVIILKLS